MISGYRSGDLVAQTEKISTRLKSCFFVKHVSCKIQYLSFQNTHQLRTNKLFKPMNTNRNFFDISKVKYPIQRDGVRATTISSS